MFVCNCSNFFFWKITIKIFVQKYPQQKKSLFIDEIKNRTLVWNSNKYIVADIRQSHEEYGLGDTLGGEA